MPAKSPAVSSIVVIESETPWGVRKEFRTAKGEIICVEYSPDNGSSAEDPADEELRDRWVQELLLQFVVHLVVAITVASFGGCMN